MSDTHPHHHDIPDNNSHSHNSSGDIHADHEDDGTPVGLGSIFVEESSIDPIVIDEIMQDLTISDSDGSIVDISLLQVHPATSEARVLDMPHACIDRDLSLVYESAPISIASSSHIYAYDDGAPFADDLIDAPRSISLIRPHLSSAEGSLVDARCISYHTREAFDVFPPQSGFRRSLHSVLSRLTGNGPSISKPARHHWKWIGVCFFLLHLLGVVSFALGAHMLFSLGDNPSRHAIDRGSLVAKYAFGTARLTLTPLAKLISFFPIVGDAGRDVGSALRIAHHSSLLARDIVLLDRAFAPESNAIFGISDAFRPGGTSNDLVAFIESNQGKINRVLNRVDYLSVDINNFVRTSSLFREEHRNEILSLSEKFRFSSHWYSANQDKLLIALGRDKPMRYLILNQNRDELRASGGFPGSVFFLEFQRGLLTQFESRDIYFYDWKLYPYQVAPPPGIRDLTSNYGLRDANYSPVFANNLAVMNGFHERSGYESLDAIFALHQGIVEDILGVIGALDFPEMNTQVTRDNFSLFLSSIVEAKIGKKDSAKDILFLFQKHFFEKIQSEPGSFDKIIDILARSLESGEILASWSDARLAEWNIQFGGVSERMKDSTNWIYPVYTSLSGNKSDRYIHRDLRVSTKYGTACNALNTVDLTLKHTLTATGMRHIESLQVSLGLTGEQLAEAVRIQGSGANISYTRVLIPKGSVVRSLPEGALVLPSDSPYADMIAFRTSVLPMREITTRFSYDTPRLGTCEITPVFLRQPGIISQNFTSSFRD